jgi:UDP-N-acetylmuramoyl-tripeptide--D-alanyl-D-alanine ligase
MEKAADAFQRLTLAKGRGSPKKIMAATGEFTLIDESYNASPVATEMAIRVLGAKQPEGNGRRLLALGDMRELGGQSRSLHESLAPAIAKADIALLFCCGEYMKYLYDSLPERQRGAWRSTSAELAPIVAEQIRAGDIITIKGSKTTEMNKVVEALEKLQRPSPVNAYRAAG